MWAAHKRAETKEETWLVVIANHTHLATVGRATDETALHAGAAAKTNNDLGKAGKL